MRTLAIALLLIIGLVAANQLTMKPTHKFDDYKKCKHWGHIYNYGRLVKQYKELVKKTAEELKEVEYKCKKYHKYCDKIFGLKAHLEQYTKYLALYKKDLKHWISLCKKPHHHEKPHHGKPHHHHHHHHEKPICHTKCHPVVTQKCETKCHYPKPKPICKPVCHKECHDKCEIKCFPPKPHHHHHGKPHHGKPHHK